MKKLLLALMVLATLASCGKDNKVSSNTSSVSYSNPYLSTNTTAYTYAQTLIGQISSYTTGFGNGVLSSSSQNCSTKWGIFYYCYSSGSTSNGQTWNSVIASNPSIAYQYSDGYTVRNSDVNIATKQSELTSILNSATNVQVQAASGGNVYYVTTSSGYYVIDTRYPIQANPSAIQVSGTNRYFYIAI